MVEVSLGPIPWQLANVQGPRTAKVINNAKVVAARIKRKKNPILIVGPNITREVEGKKLIDYAIEMGKAGITIVTTAHVVKEFIKAGFNNVVSMGLSDISNRLRDPNWKGFKGEGKPELALYLGGLYYTQSQSLSALKHFSDVETISLDREYHPNADWSFPNLNPKEWKETMDELVGLLK
ncbi:MAG: CO dehydrogenase/acetyl-CoA synthase complex subunit epsilon [Candidatus Jordarchaeales archaeon]|nr:CO dehydrogenase/acetyl-CoA synthase complex subunit epsilon [Candidatus Jordarchaeia archaeon]